MCVSVYSAVRIKALVDDHQRPDLAITLTLDSAKEMHSERKNAKEQEQVQGAKRKTEKNKRGKYHSPQLSWRKLNSPLFIILKLAHINLLPKTTGSSEADTCLSGKISFPPFSLPT